ncbi:MAG: phosphatidylserine decarboxylase [Phycisphaerae bacterium]
MVWSTAGAGVILWAAGEWLWPGAWFWAVLILLVLVWGWSIAFFRDPKRQGTFSPNELCAPADGRVADITELETYAPIDGPAVRIGIFLGLCDVHINRSPCGGTVRSTTYRAGKFLAAMNPAAGEVNESNTMVLDAAPPIAGPVVVRQVAGMAARRIVCHARERARLSIGERFGLIKFGSRTELIVPKSAGMEVLVVVGDKVRAGLTVLMRCPLGSEKATGYERGSEDAAGIGAPAASAPA